jgi:DNA-binding NarL/FixJ family response regulator
MIRVVLADDQALVRSGLRALLRNSDDLEVVGEARDGRDAVAVVTRTRPDVVLMDVRMPGVDGIAATRQITADLRLSGVAIIMLTTFDEDDHIFAAIRAGALPAICSRTLSRTTCGTQSASWLLETPCCRPQ